MTSRQHDTHMNERGGMTESTTPLVERLRARRKLYTGVQHKDLVDPDCEEAADTLERLERELSKARQTQWDTLIALQNELVDKSAALSQAREALRELVRLEDMPLIDYCERAEAIAAAWQAARDVLEGKK